jgi:DNA helicase-2/ATP-dependent DNA helicase PcrA
MELPEAIQDDDEAAYLLGLNEMQRVAVVRTEGPSIVIAGAGSGKTRVLTTRIAHVLKTQKATPPQILALTFTNKAAAEMRHRIATVVGENTNGLWLGTFHSVFVKLLRKEAPRLGYPSHFSIYDSEDSKSLLKQLIKTFQLDDTVYKPNMVLSRISQAKNRLITPEAYASDAHYQEEDAHMRMPKFSTLFLAYARHCQQAGAMDFDDLLLHTHTLLHTDPDVCTKYQQHFQYLFIDEFQDTNRVQYNIVKKLAEPHQNLCVVGDDAQSIYAFRGATIQNILHFTTDYPNHHIVKLEQNYRSTQHIVTTANRIILHNEAQLKKNVWTSNDLGEPVTLIRAASDIEESNLVVHAILEKKWKHQLQNQDFAILYRTNSQSRNFEEALRKKNIPYRIVGGLSFYQRKEVKDLLAYLRFVVNPNDAEAFKRIVNVPRRGIGSAGVKKVFMLANAHKCSLWEVLTASNQLLTGPTAKAMERFVDFIRSFIYNVTMDSANAYSIAAAVAKESGLLKELYEDKTIEGLTRYEHIHELLNSIKQFVDNPENNDPSLGNFLQEVALLATGAEDNSNQDVVTLMTIHASKGLEFKYVYLVGMEEDLFPSARMIGSKEDLEEERRLFYVAVTRAQKKVTLSYALSRYRFGKAVRTKPSRFLHEIVLEPPSISTPSNIPKKTSVVPVKKSMYVAAPPISPGISGENCMQIQTGYEVKHAQFGRGSVLHVIEEGGMRKAVIHFHAVGKKTLLLNYAKLEIVSVV